MLEKQMTCLAEREFPFAIPDMTLNRDRYEEFGHDGIDTDGYDPYGYPIYTYDHTARWAYWRCPRFRTLNDAIEFKLRFG